MLMINIIKEGGPFFMVPMLLLFIVIVILFLKEILRKNDREKTIRLISSISLFAAVWGILGQVIGLIVAFDTIDGLDGVSMGVLAGGLKVTFLPVVGGLFTFLVARIGIIILTWSAKTQ